jgi:hypothetical protein
MSAINRYKHRHLGFVECPSTFDFVYNNQAKEIAIYELLENIPNDEKDFDGKVGDIILGGGSGEAPAFRISIPETIYFFIKEDWNEFKVYEDLFKAFWTPTQSYKLCEGFSKIGWTVNFPIEFWLAENICLLLIGNIEHYSTYKTSSISKSILSFLKMASV